ncbi:MAG: hypothetical protein LBG52_09050 [Candidatus Peribacteria bacterium]|nr:hypothetical protein [Candidatus Peribacteria bacterium]
MLQVEIVGIILSSEYHDKMGYLILLNDMKNTKVKNFELVDEVVLIPILDVIIVEEVMVSDEQVETPEEEMVVEELITPLLLSEEMEVFMVLVVEGKLLHLTIPINEEMATKELSLSNMELPDEG